jgi:GTPase
MIHFIDEAEICCQGGNGGVGMKHFRREKHVPMGGPDGGDGGKGGDIVLQGDEGLSTLFDFKLQKNYIAQNGYKGGTSRKTGGEGHNTILKVPCGTVVFDIDTDECLGEVVKHGETLLVARGGKGGLGNQHFATSRNQAPDRTIDPEKGENKVLKLELKLLADVGLVGFPNAGKSTLVSVLSAAKPKIANYPFTTLVPQLGVVSPQSLSGLKDFPAFVIADLPGIIEFASQGKGLGFQFLKHIARTKVLVFLIEIDALPVMKHKARILWQEIQNYGSGLSEKPKCFVCTKLDTISEPDQQQACQEFQDWATCYFSASCLSISAASHHGLLELVQYMVPLVFPTPVEGHYA